MPRGYLPGRTTHTPDELLTTGRSGRLRLLDAWVISDLHLGHDRLEVDGPLGGVRPHGFTEVLVAAIRQVVRTDDDLLTLGDTLVGWPRDQPMPSLPGTLWTVLGNHDRGKVDKLVDGSWRILDPFSTVYRDWVLTFSHEPLPPDEIAPGEISVHGHTHAKAEISDRHLNLCAEHLDYRPRRLGELLDGRIDMLAQRERRPPIYYPEEKFTAREGDARVFDNYQDAIEWAAEQNARLFPRQPKPRTHLDKEYVTITRETNE